MNRTAADKGLTARLDRIASELELIDPRLALAVDQVSDRLDRKAMKNGVKYRELPPKTRFLFNDSTWEKRSDGLGADLVGRDGSISFIGGKRHSQKFKDDCEVFPK